MLFTSLDVAGSPLPTRLGLQMEILFNISKIWFLLRMFGVRDCVQRLGKSDLDELRCMNSDASPSDSELRGVRISARRIRWICQGSCRWVQRSAFTGAALGRHNFFDLDPIASRKCQTEPPPLAPFPTSDSRDRECKS